MPLANIQDMEIEKNCGNCSYFEKPTEIRTGVCTAPLPQWIAPAVYTILQNPLVRDYDGSDCPAFQPKENNNAK